MPIGAIVAAIAFGIEAFVGVDAEMGKLVDQVAFAAFDRTLGIGILETEEIDTLALLRRHIGNHRREKGTGMEESGRRRGETSHLRTLGEGAGRIFRFEIFDAGLDLGE